MRWVGGVGGGGLYSEESYNSRPHLMAVTNLEIASAFVLCTLIPQPTSASTAKSFPLALRRRQDLD